MKLQTLLWDSTYRCRLYTIEKSFIINVVLKNKLLNNKPSNTAVFFRVCFGLSYFIRLQYLFILKYSRKDRNVFVKVLKENNNKRCTVLSRRESCRVRQFCSNQELHKGCLTKNMEGIKKKTLAFVVLFQQNV